MYLCGDACAAHFVVKRSRECFCAYVDSLHLAENLCDLRYIQHIVHIGRRTFHYIYTMLMHHFGQENRVVYLLLRCHCNSTAVIQTKAFLQH